MADIRGSNTNFIPCRSWSLSNSQAVLSWPWFCNVAMISHITASSLPSLPGSEPDSGLAAVSLSYFPVCRRSGCRQGDIAQTDRDAQSFPVASVTWDEDIGLHIGSVILNLVALNNLFFCPALQRIVKSVVCPWGGDCENRNRALEKIGRPARYHSRTPSPPRSRKVLRIFVL